MQNLCTTAAYRPVRELIQQERLKNLVTSQFTFNIVYDPDYVFTMVTSECCFCFLVFWQEKKQKAAKGQNKDVEDRQEEQSVGGNTQEVEEKVQQERVITLRPLNMQDFREAKNQVTFKKYLFFKRNPIGFKFSINIYGFTMMYIYIWTSSSAMLGFLA